MDYVECAVPIINLTDFIAAGGCANLRGLGSINDDVLLCARTEKGQRKKSSAGCHKTDSRQCPLDGVSQFHTYTMPYCTFIDECFNYSLSHCLVPV